MPLIWLGLGGLLIFVIIIILYLYSAPAPEVVPPTDPAVSTVTAPGQPAVTSMVVATPISAGAPSAPAGARLIGIYNAPKLTADGGLALGHQFGTISCSGADCPQVCMDKVKGYYPGGKFAITATNQCRGGSGDLPFDNNGTAEWGLDSAWALYDF